MSQDREQHTPRILAESSASSPINAPTADIDVTDWLFNIDELEYVNCTPKSRAHLTAGFTHAPDGKRMSINVEDVGGALVIEHYNEVICEKLHCRVQSISDLLIGREYTTTHVIWELIVVHKEGDHHELTNNVWVHTTPKYDAFLDSHNIPYEVARQGFQQSLDAHNAEETPNFAASIKRKALRQRN